MHVTNVDRTPKTRKVVNSSIVTGEGVESIALYGVDASLIGTRNSVILNRNALKSALPTKTAT